MNIPSKDSIPVSRIYCPNSDSYSPCHCTPNWLSCYSSSISSIAKMFKQKLGWNRIENLDLRLLSTESFIPAHLLTYHWVASEIYIECELWDSPSLQIDRDAFWSSRNSTQSFRIINCKISKLNFYFLEGFYNLTNIILISDNGVQLASLPLLPKLNYIRISDTTGLTKLSTFPKLVNGIETLQLDNNNIDDITIDSILKWVIESPTVDTLNELDISSNLLTKIPHHISSFKVLNHIKMGSNPLNSNIYSGSFYFKSHSSLHLESCGIDTIESGAFQGIQKKLKKYNTNIVI